jgi:hypothetical protein
MLTVVILVVVTGFDAQVWKTERKPNCNSFTAEDAEHARIFALGFALKAKS